MHRTKNELLEYWRSLTPQERSCTVILFLSIALTILSTAVWPFPKEWRGPVGFSVVTSGVICWLCGHLYAHWPNDDSDNAERDRRFRSPEAALLPQGGMDPMRVLEWLSRKPQTRGEIALKVVLPAVLLTLTVMFSVSGMRDALPSAAQILRTPGR